MDIVYAKGPNSLIWILRSLKIECRASSFVATFVIKCASATALSHNIFFLLLLVLLVVLLVVLVVLVVVFNPYKSRFCFLFLLIHEQTNTQKGRTAPIFRMKRRRTCCLLSVCWTCILELCPYNTHWRSGKMCILYLGSCCCCSHRILLIQLLVFTW